VFCTTVSLPKLKVRYDKEKKYVGALQLLILIVTCKPRKPGGVGSVAGGATFTK